MKFDTFKWDDPTLFGDYLNPRVSFPILYEFNSIIR